MYATEVLEMYSDSKSPSRIRGGIVGEGEAVFVAVGVLVVDNVTALVAVPVLIALVDIDGVGV